MYQTTTKLVAVTDHGHYLTFGYYPDGSPHTTCDVLNARQFAPNEEPPPGFRLKTVTYRTQVCGGGFYWSQGTTMG